MAEDFKTPKDTIGKVTKIRPAVVEKLNSKTADIYEAKETSPDRLRVSKDYKLAMWCESVEEAREKAKEMNQRVAFGRPKVSKTPGNAESGREWAMPKEEKPGTPVRQNHDYKISSAESLRKDVRTNYLLAVNAESLRPIAPDKLLADIKDEKTLDAKVALVHKTGGSVARRLFTQIIKSAEGAAIPQAIERTPEEELLDAAKGLVLDFEDTNPEELEMSAFSRLIDAIAAVENSKSKGIVEASKKKVPTSRFPVGTPVKSKIGEVGIVVEEEIGGKVGVEFQGPHPMTELVSVRDLTPIPQEPSVVVAIKADDSINPVPPTSEPQGVPVKKEAPVPKPGERKRQGFAEKLQKNIDKLNQRPKKGTSMDQEIGQAWGQYASGVQIPIMDIPVIYDEIRQALATGKTMEEAVKESAAKHQLKASKIEAAPPKPKGKTKPAAQRKAQEAPAQPAMDFETKARGALSKALNMAPEDLEISSAEGDTVTFQAGKESYTVYPTYDAAHEAALLRVKEDLEKEPEIFDQDWLAGWLDASDLDKQLTAQDLADSQTEDLRGRELEAEAERRGIEIGDGEKNDDAIREELNTAIYDEILSDIKKEGYADYMISQGLYSTVKEVMDAGFIRLWGDDMFKAAEQAVNMDGPGHFLSSYDGELHELEGGMQYTQN